MDAPARIRTPGATGLLVCATVAASLILTLGRLAPDAAILAGFIPARLSGLLVFGNVVAVPAWLTPLSATLVHGGFLHLLMNMVALLFCGHAVERALGLRAVLLLYFFGAYAAAFAQWLPDPASPVPMIGASGAISALIGAYSLLFGQSRARAFGPIPAAAINVLWLAAAWIGVNLLMGFAFSEGGAPIAIAAHIGGFLLGVALARPLLLWRWRQA